MCDTILRSYVLLLLLLIIKQYIKDPKSRPISAPRKHTVIHQPLYTASAKNVDTVKFTEKYQKKKIFLVKFFEFLNFILQIGPFGPPSRYGIYTRCTCNGCST